MQLKKQIKNSNKSKIIFFYLIFWFISVVGLLGTKKALALIGSSKLSSRARVWGANVNTLVAVTSILVGFLYSIK